MRHVDRGTIGCHSHLIHAERIVGDPCHHVMHEIIGQQAAIAASAIVHATLADVEQALIGCHRHASLACFRNGELLYQRVVVVNIIDVDLAIIDHVEPM